MTQQRFFAWAVTQDAPYEFDGTQPVAMTGGNARHDRITGNINVALRLRLRGTPCSNYGPNLGVQTIGSIIRYPDALITGTKFPDTAKLAPNVIVVFEVLSPTPGGADRIEKVREYNAVPPIRRYIIVESASPGAQVLHRDSGDATWTTDVLAAGEVLVIPEVRMEVPLAEFYENIEFEPNTSEPDTTNNAQS